MPPTSQAPSSRAKENKGARRRTRHAAEENDNTIMEEEEEDEDESNSDASESESESEEESEEEESADEEVASPATRPTMHNRPQSYTNSKRRAPPKPLNVSSNRRRNRASNTNNNGGGGSGSGGSSAPSYEDSTSLSNGDNYAYLPTPPSGRQFPQNNNNNNKNQHLSPNYQQPWTSPLSPPLPPPSLHTRRPRRPRTNTLPPAWEQDQQQRIHQQSSAEDSSSTASSSATGPWRSVAPSSLATKQPSGTRPLPLKRNKTVREPAGAPVQAVVPRAPRTVAAARTRQMNGGNEYYDDFDDDDDEDEDDDVEELPGIPTYQEPEGGRPPMQEIQRTRKLPAGGKKAKLAVELKLNLEIEIELKAYIHGDVTLELFN